MRPWSKHAAELSLVFLLKVLGSLVYLGTNCTAMHETMLFRVRQPHPSSLTLHAFIYNALALRILQGLGLVSGSQKRALKVGAPYFSTTRLCGVRTFSKSALQVVISNQAFLPSPL